MSYTNGLDKPSDYFNTVLYTGDLQDSDGTGHTQSITGVGFTPDWVWHKGRSGARTHILVDSVRGLTNYNWLITNSTSSEITANTNGAIKSIDSDGITLENGNDSSSKSNNAGKNGETWVFWNWLAGGSASSNTDGTITSTVSANQTSGFSIVTYSGNSTAGATVGHGLVGVVPSVVLVKSRDGAYGWGMYHHKNTSAPETDYLSINSTDATVDDVNFWNDTAPTSSVFSLGGTDAINKTSNSHVAYVFAEKKGYSKFGSYTGGSDPFVYLGFKPAFVMFKNASATENWRIVDNKRDVDNPVVQHLYPNLSNAEGSGASYNDFVDFTAQGFKIRSGSGEIDGSGNTIIYMAFAESPFVTSTGIPTTAR